jgi:ribose transport system permease protein
LTALTLFISKNNQITGVFPDWFGKITTGELFGLNYDVYYLLILALIVWYVLEHTPIGRSLFAVGGNPEAARLAGVPNGRLIRGSLVFSSAVAGIAGVLLVSKLGLFDNSYGPSYLFPAFAAVFFGATQFKNRPNVWGTLVAMYALAAGVTGLELKFFGSDYWINPLFQGLALLVAVALASTQVTGRSLREWRRRLRRTEGPPSADDPTDPVHRPPGADPVPTPVAVSRTDVD